MNNIIKNSWTLFTRNKEYFSSIVLTPVIMLLIFSFVLSFQSKVNIAFINQDNTEFGKMIEDTINDMDFVKPLSIDIDDVENYILNDKIDLAIIVKNTSDFSATDIKPLKIIKAKNSDLAEYIEIILNAKIHDYQTDYNSPFEVYHNSVEEKGIPIANALGIIIFKMLGSASLLAGLIILERKSGIKDRIYMSQTKISTYIIGRGAVFFIHLLLFTIIYFTTAKLFHFDFGMKYPAQILIVFVVLSIFTTAYGLFLSAFTNDDNTVWRIAVMVLLPTSILSGALFPFSSMPSLLQSIGSIFPQRWVVVAIETLQNGGTIFDTLIPLSGLLILSLILFGIASFRLSKSKY